jgi:cbb3-type cytochrome oxidase subunit 3
MAQKVTATLLQPHIHVASSIYLVFRFAAHAGFVHFFSLITIAVLCITYRPDSMDICDKT